MKPIKFKGYNCIFAKDQPEYIPLPVKKIIGHKGEIISVWKPTLKERIKILFGFNIGLSLLTFNEPLQPLKIFIYKKEY